MIIRGGTVVTARTVEPGDIAIEDGVIIDVGRHVGGGGEEIDATGLHIFPGSIDAHVHLNEPGRTEWEDIAHGSAALAAGGATAFIDMPLNSLPVTTTVEAFDLKLSAMRRGATIAFGLWGGLVPGNLDELGPLVERGVIGFKAFMCPSGIEEFPACDERTLREGMQRIAGLDSILLVHAEAPDRLLEPGGPTARDYVASRPPEAEWAAITIAIELAAETGCRLHIVHVSTAHGFELIRQAQVDGIDVSGETCPHYLLYSSADLDRLGGLGKCSPPFRSAPELLRRMVNAGQVQIVVSDHSPSPPQLKQGGDFRTTWGGISGCQSTRQLLLADRRLDLRKFAALTSTNIAERFRLRRRGDIAPGFEADLWIADLGWEGVIRRQDLLYKNPFSVHEGQRVRGRTVRTIAQGGFMRPARD